MGRTPDGSRHESRRVGNRRRRIAKRVYAPISARDETLISKATPAGKERSNRGNLVQVRRPPFDADARRLKWIGHRCCVHESVMSAPAGALTASRLIVTRKAKTRPVIRTIGKGYISPAEAGGRAICTDSVAT